MKVKSKVKQAFGHASSSYDSVAALQREVGHKLLAQIGVIDRQDRVLDLGCGTGFMGYSLLEQKRITADQLISLDIAMPMLRNAGAKFQDSLSPCFVCGDLESLPFASQSIDLLVSNLALQWCETADRAFTEIHHVLKPGGRVILSTFGTKTLHELKCAWQSVDNFSHVNDFYSVDALERLITMSGLVDVHCESHCYINRYTSVVELMKELKMLGAHTVTTGRNKRFTSRTAMQYMIDTYQNQSTTGAILATFEVIFLSASRIK